MIEEASKIIAQRQNLNAVQMQQVMEEIMSGSSSTGQIVDFLQGLNKKNETVEELIAAVEVMRRHVTKINTKHKIILDTCGTGGDKLGTFNISTTACFVVSASAVAVAKHGNRSVSSCCGSADILEALGVKINASVSVMENCLNEIGLAFLFAQDLHPAMKFAAVARKQIAAKTIFNIIGPLSNPAGATHQLAGVFDPNLNEMVAQVLKSLGSSHALVVAGSDGMDEITTTAGTKVSELFIGRIDTYTISPEDFGFKKAKLADLRGGSVSDNARILLDVLNGKEGPCRDIVLLNAGAAIYAADRASSIKDGIELAKHAIDSKAALGKLELLKEYSNKT